MEIVLKDRDHKAIEQAKELLKNYGYFTDNLWHVDDVLTRFDCDEDTAQSILNDALTNDATFEQVWLAIDCAISSHQNF